MTTVPRARVARLAALLALLGACGPAAQDEPASDLAQDAAQSGLTPPESVLALDLAVLPGLPQFADGPRPGHVAAHGALPPRREKDARSEVPELTFDDLAAPDYEAPGVASGALPADLDRLLGPAVLAARGRVVAFEGFATVERSEGGVATALLLTPLPPACCLGRVPRADECVHVELPAALGLVVDPWRPVRVVGRFAAEERRDVLGLFEGLYFVDAQAASTL